LEKKEEKQEPCKHENMIEYEFGRNLYCPDCNTMFKETMFGRLL